MAALIIVGLISFASLVLASTSLGFSVRTEKQVGPAGSAGLSSTGATGSTGANGNATPNYWFLLTNGSATLPTTGSLTNFVLFPASLGTNTFPNSPINSSNQFQFTAQISGVYQFNISFESINAGLTGDLIKVTCTPLRRIVYNSFSQSDGTTVMNTFNLSFGPMYIFSGSIFEIMYSTDTGTGFNNITYSISGALLR